MSQPRLKPLDPSLVFGLRRAAVDSRTLAVAADIVDAVRAEGETAVRRYAVEFGEIANGEPLVFGRESLQAALKSITAEERRLLDRTAERIELFAEAQRAAVGPVTVEIPGGRAGQRVDAVAVAGCYAPGGRYPLPSSVLMTGVTARVAGVREVWIASPRPAPITFAAAAVSGAAGLLVVGGAHAVAALAFGAAGNPACDVVVGPGNRWVTAAKQLVAGEVGIDMLAGPSELVILADSSADPEVVAADLLAQAEHDPDALAILVTTEVALKSAVERELTLQLADLPTRDVALTGLDNGFSVVAQSMEEAIEVCDRLAPEHLQVMCADAAVIAERLDQWGALFIGSASAEVLGDYGAGPNHTLPTGGVARYKGGLSVFDFLRVRTWLEIDQASEAHQLVADAVQLARLEGLEGHARAAERRCERTEGTRSPVYGEV